MGLMGHIGKAGRAAVWLLSGRAQGELADLQAAHRDLDLWVLRLEAHIRLHRQVPDKARNQFCSCGSGKKVKHCCGKPKP